MTGVTVWFFFMLWFGTVNGDMRIQGTLSPAFHTKAECVEVLRKMDLSGMAFVSPCIEAPAGTVEVEDRPKEGA